MTDSTAPTEPAAPADPSAPTTQPALFELPDPASGDSAADPAAVEAGDLAAEIDDSVPADATGEPDYRAEDPDYTGICRGGPYDGRTVPCRFAGGFVLVDKPNTRMWTYRTDPAQPGQFFVVADGHPAPLTDLDNLDTAANGVEFDVIAYDEGTAGA